MIELKLLEAFRSPCCNPELNYNREELVCKKCRLVYTLENGIPVILREEAREK
jgi:uncharacterized protein YbaR (Trm112 family)